ncbi:hypothetical protein LPTSP3_g25390 [Leptospira kobayashii]|uniref:Lipoprotein n=1 Tax=Leptospira kobayashii TaxID=1917830 RepID=A0ABN6KEW8_9LEPT|nr:hypothetical protein [Leptospira kobayashii]BDA79609.1 hypothetical protein LPTSP3_g25390 [Leptospira kobayashii]
MKYSKLILLVICLFLFASNGCKKKRYGKDWIKGPEREELSPGIFYIRNKSSEEDFIKYEMDPREISIKEVVPFIIKLREDIKNKNFEAIVKSTTMAGDLRTKLGDKRITEAAFDIWISDYKKNGKDIYCGFDDLFSKPVTKIEFSLTNLGEPSETNSIIFYNIDYVIKVLYEDKEPLVLRTFLSSDFDNKYPRNYISEYVGRCPRPRLNNVYEEWENME